MKCEMWNVKYIYIYIYNVNSRENGDSLVKKKAKIFNFYSSMSVFLKNNSWMIWGQGHQ